MEIIVKTRDDKTLEMSVRDASYLDMLEAMTTVLERVMSETLDKVPLNNRQEAAGDMADDLNAAFTYLYNEFSEKRSDGDLTEVAIMEAENAMIEEAYQRQVPLEHVVEEHRRNAEAKKTHLKNRKKMMS